MTILEVTLREYGLSRYTRPDVPIGSLAYDNILQRMLDRGTFMTRATAQYFLNAFFEFAAGKIADDVVRINMGAVSLYPMIGGSATIVADTLVP